MITQQQFDALAREGYNRIPLSRTLHADLDTPLSLYLKLANRPWSYLLESVEGGERFGRYSFIGLPARERLVVRGQRLTIEGDFETRHDAEVEDPLAVIDDYLRELKVWHQPGEPRFMGGLAGYFGYETVRHIEPRLARRPAKEQGLDVPDILLLVSDELAIVDNLAGRIHLVVHADPRQPHARERAIARLEELYRLARRPAELPDTPQVANAEAESEFGQAAYEAVVERARAYIREGDIMQVVPSQRMKRPFAASPLTLYRALRSINPSPYMFFYDFGDFHVVGASPEILVRLEDDTVTVRPIAGTRPRGGDRSSDEALATELLADPKELAEHLMLVDLGRNDVGRVASTGSVKLTERMVIERYSHVMHIVSNVEGQLKPGLSAMDVLRATFPAGTVSGAPKVRAMEIIDEFEPTRRGVYAGAVGYLGYQGDMDLAIAIRTAVVRDGWLYVQSGGGLVADSVPEAEWQETQNKARALLRAADLACRGLRPDSEATADTPPSTGTSSSHP